MPQLNEILAKRQEKTFVKKTYRPWDLTGGADNNNEQASLVTTITSDQTANKIDNTKTTENPHKDNNKTTKDNTKETIRQLLDNNQLTNNQQSDNELSNLKGNVLDNNLLILSIKNLTGIQEKMFYYVIEMCCSRGILETGPILTSDIANAANCSYGSAKISLERLIKKGLIVRRQGKRSKGGYINLTITAEIRLIAIEAKRQKDLMPIINNLITEKIHGLEKKLGNNIDNNPLYSSSIIKNTTTNLPEEWKKINFEELNEIGFSASHLSQLYQQNLNTPDIIQESIHHFAFALQHNEKYKNHLNPLNVLMGVLRKGQGWFEKNYISQQEIAQRKLIEWKKAERERKKELEENAYKFALEEWQETLSVEELEKIAPSKQGRGDIMPQVVKLSLYFREKIWPNKKEEYLVSR